ncbi:MAG TPA: hypothetical protein VD929_05600 [Caulobacteraceae bacterium]|nr:hypothetical protein [Caulobacteraceae bacterium]
MFDFERELKRILGVSAARECADPSLLELLDVKMLAGQGRAADIAAGRVSAKRPHVDQLDAAAVWREHARRTGDAVTLRKAAKAAERAGKAAENPAERARAALEQAVTSLVGADLFGDTGLLDSARELLICAGEHDGDAVIEARIEAAYARIAAREALATGDYARALEAAALFDKAIHRLEQLTAAKGSPAVRLEAAAARMDRADLMAGFGLQMRDDRLLRQAADDLADLMSRLDADYEPLTWVRAAELCGSTLVALGEITGRAEHVAEGVSALAEPSEKFTRDHSPLDWARWQHALALGLQALGETCDSDAAFDQAERAFAEALRAASVQGLTLRATVANNRAACMARRAERRGDLIALAKAEAAFKAELAGMAAAEDPIPWAVIQTNLGRLYEARAELLGDFRERESAAYAFEAALDVFCDHGLKSLAEAAGAGLKRLARTG